MVISVFGEPVGMGGHENYSSRASVVFVHYDRFWVRLMFQHTPAIQVESRLRMALRNLVNAEPCRVFV